MNRVDWVRCLTVMAVGGAVTMSPSSPAPAQSQARTTLVQHDFATSAQGWRISGDTGVVGPIFNPSGGNPGGYIAGDDEAVGETWYFRAPGAVVEQLPAAERGTISFSLKQSATDAAFPDDDIIIVGAAGRISYRFPRPPETDWTGFSVRLSESEGWRWNWNAPATQTQIHRVLAEPRRFHIRGEYRTGHDVGGLDNFALTAGPPWETAAGHCQVDVEMDRLRR